MYQHFGEQPALWRGSVHLKGTGAGDGGCGAGAGGFDGAAGEATAGDGEEAEDEGLGSARPGMVIVSAANPNEDRSS